MAEKRMALNEELLDEVVGGLFTFHKKSMRLDYEHPDGSVTSHSILNLQAAWELSNNLHAQMVPEDDILAQLMSKGYIA